MAGLDTARGFVESGTGDFQHPWLDIRLILIVPLISQVLMMSTEREDDRECCGKRMKMCVLTRSSVPLLQLAAGHVARHNRRHRLVKRFKLAAAAVRPCSTSTLFTDMHHINFCGHGLPDQA